MLRICSTLKIYGIEGKLLTKDEKTLIKDTFARGISIFFEDYDPAWTTDQIADFFSREDVQQYMKLLKSDFDEQEIAQARVKFIVKRRLITLQSNATGIIARALAGPVYARDGKGNTLHDFKGQPLIRDPAPTPMQLSAARDVLERLNVRADTSTDKGGAAINVNVNIGEKAIELSSNVDSDPAFLTPEDRALSRERMRNAMELLMKKVPMAHKQLEDSAIDTKSIARRKKRNKKEKQERKVKNDNQRRTTEKKKEKG